MKINLNTAAAAIKVSLNTAAPIAVETHVEGNIVLGYLEYNEGDSALGIDPHFVLTDDVSSDFPILWEGQDVTFRNGWFVFEDVVHGDIQFKFAGY